MQEDLHKPNRVEDRNVYSFTVLSLSNHEYMSINIQIWTLICVNLLYVLAEMEGLTYTALCCLSA